MPGEKCSANVSACGRFMFVYLPGLPVALSLDAETASDLAELLEEKLVEMVQPLNSRHNETSAGTDASGKKL